MSDEINPEVVEQLKGEKLRFSELKETVLKRADYRCEECGSNKRIQVHHKRYGKNIAEADLIVLYQTCHFEAHGYRSDHFKPSMVCIELLKTGKEIGIETKAGKYICILCLDAGKEAIFESNIEFWKHCLSTHPELKEELY